MCIYIYVYIYVFVCVYIYVCIYRYVFTYIAIDRFPCSDTQGESELGREAINVLVDLCYAHKDDLVVILAVRDLAFTSRRPPPVSLRLPSGSFGDPQTGAPDSARLDACSPHQRVCVPLDAAVTPYNALQDIRFL